MTVARDFARLQFDWLKQVQDDPAITVTGFALAFAICRHINAQSLDAWPNQETLGKLIDANARTVRRLANMLHAQGHLTVEHGRQHAPNKYRLRLHSDRTPMSALQVVRPDTRDLSEKVQTGHLEHSDRTFDDTQTGHPCPPNTLKEHPEEHLPAKPAAVAALATPVSASHRSAVIPTQEADLYRRGKEVLGSSAGGLIRQLVQAKGGSVAQARSAIEQASEKQDAREYVGAIIRGRDSPEDQRARGDRW